MTRTSNTGVAGLAVLAAILASPAQAGMGAVRPTYHPKPCSGDDCRGDDPRSNRDCTGLLCTFSSAKAMAPPVTAAQAAEMERAQAAAAAAGGPPNGQVPGAASAR